MNTAKDTAGTSTPVANASTAAASASAGNLIVVGVVFVHASAVVGSITDTAGSVYRQAPKALVRAQDNSCADVWYAPNTPGNGSNVIQVNWTGGSVTFNRIIANQYSGIALVNPCDTGIHGVSYAGTAVATNSFQSVYANEVIFAITSAGISSNTYAAGTNFTLRDSKLTDTITEDRIVSSTGNYNALISYTAASTELVMAAAAFADTDFSDPIGYIGAAG